MDFYGKLYFPRSTVCTGDLAKVRHANIVSRGRQSRRISEVEHLRTKLYAFLSPNGKAAKEREIIVFEPIGTQCISTQVAIGVVLRNGHSGSVKPFGLALIGKRQSSDFVEPFVVATISGIGNISGCTKVKGRPEVKVRIVLTCQLPII